MKWPLTVAVLSLAATVPQADGRFPHLTVSMPPSQTVTVADIDSVPAEGVCVVYVSLDETLNDAPYAPRHCVALDEQVPSYVDDWDSIPSGHTYDVHAELTIAGHNDVIRTNVLRIVRE